MVAAVQAPFSFVFAIKLNEYDNIVNLNRIYMYKSPVNALH